MKIKVIHKAKLVSPSGDVSPLCANLPRKLNLKKESWTLKNDLVTCPKCIAKLMKRVECSGIVGKFPTPKGIQTFYDTGRKVSAVDLAEALTLQHSFFVLPQTEEATKEIYDFATRIAKKANVYPVGYAALADDGRILVTEPWYESKEE